MLHDQSVGQDGCQYRHYFAHARGNPAHAAPASALDELAQDLFDRLDVAGFDVEGQIRVELAKLHAAPRLAHQLLDQGAHGAAAPIRRRLQLQQHVVTDFHGRSGGHGDAAAGVLEEGYVAVSDMLARQPWTADFPMEVVSVPAAGAPVEQGLAEP